MSETLRIIVKFTPATGELTTESPAPPHVTMSVLQSAVHALLAQAIKAEIAAAGPRVQTVDGATLNRWLKRNEG